jgi:hypothetical protein
LRNRYENASRSRGPTRWGSAGWVCAQRLLAGLLVLGGVAQCPLGAQTNATKAAHAPDRYLLIVETSKSMQRRADAVLGTVWYLLGSGLNGQFRDGGTLGVWTFNQDLSAGVFPLQAWSSSAQKDITQRTITFLKGQKYGKRANFDEVALALSRVIEASEVITVVLISSGDVKIRGTPFDDRINAAYQEFRVQQQKARMPFVTVLRARHGQVVDYIVNTPPWPLQVPRLPEESKSVEAPHGKPREALHNAPSSTVPPLIVSGKKPKPEPAPGPKPEPAPARAEPPAPVVAAAVTNEPAQVKPSEPAAAPAEVAKVEPAPVVSPKPATEPVPEPKAETMQAPKALTTEPAPAKSEAVLPLPLATPNPEPAPAWAEPLPLVPAATVTDEPAVMKQPEPAAPAVEVARVEPVPVAPAQPATESAPKPVPAPKPVTEPKAETVKAPEAKATEPTPAKPEAILPPPAAKPLPKPVTVEQPKPSPAPEVKTGLAPGPSATPEALPAAAPSALADQVTTSNSSSLAPPPSSRPAPPAQSATAVPGEALMRTGIILIAAVLLAFVVVGFAFLLTRRSRTAPQGSLITRSFEREKGP